MRAEPSPPGEPRARVSPNLVVEKLVAGGDGMAHLPDGRVAFVPGALPGDEIEPTARDEKKGYVRVTEWQLVREGAERKHAPCPVVEQCGGCDWMRLTRDAELSAKRDILVEALRRVGKLEAPRVDVVSAGPEFGYRQRARFHVDDAGRVGFFSRHSHHLVVMDECLVCHDDVNAALSRLRAIPPPILAEFSDVEVRRADSDPRLMLAFSLRRRPLSDGAAVAVADLRKEYWVHLEGARPGARFQRYALDDRVELFAAAEVFTQVNWEVNRAFVAHVVSGLEERGAKSFADLYAGAGNFALPLLSRGLSGIAVERAGAAIESARAAAAAQGFSPDVFVAAEALDWVQRAVADASTFDAVIVDPPRAGAREVVDQLVRLAPRLLILCGCDPVTLARDAGALARGGYRVVGATVFDMFPQTHHFETVLWMER